MALSKKRKAFIEEYLLDFNATQAAIRAGYAERSAGSIGHENLKIPEIAEEIQKRLDDKVMSANEALVRISEIARAEFSEYITAEGEPDLERLKADGKMHLVKEVYETKYGKRVVPYDAYSALADIGMHHGLFFADERGSEEHPVHINVIEAIAPDGSNE